MIYLRAEIKKNGENFERMISGGCKFLSSVFVWMKVSKFDSVESDPCISV